MKVLIFVATGTAGLLAVRAALKRGYDVTAFVGNPAKLALTDPHLTVIRGELSDGAAIDATIRGQDAVVSLLGPNKGASGSPLTDGFKLIVGAMEHHGVSRIVATSTPSFPQEDDRLVLSFSLAVLLIRTLARSVYRDVVGSAEVIAASRLDWTIVRLPVLSDKPQAGTPVAGRRSPVRWDERASAFLPLAR